MSKSVRILDPESKVIFIARQESQDGLAKPVPSSGSQFRIVREPTVNVKNNPIIALQPPFFVRYANVLVLPQNERNDFNIRYFRGQEFKVGPLFMFVITVIQISVHLYCAIYNMMDTMPNGRCYLKNLFAFNSARRYEIWRYLTYMLIHRDNSHLLLNVLVQTFVGFPLEMVHGFRRTCIIYIGGVIGGSLGQSILNGGTYCLIGASAGVYSLLAAILSNMIVNWSELDYRWPRFIVYVAFLIVDIIRNFSFGDTNVSVISHMFGAFSGLLLGLYFVKNLRIEKWEIALGTVALIIYVIVMVSLIGIINDLMMRSFLFEKANN